MTGRDVAKPPQIPVDAPSGFRQFLGSHRRPLLILFFAGLLVVFAFAVLPQVAGFGRSLHRLRDGDMRWLLAGIGFECLSLIGYMALLRWVFSCGDIRIGWRASSEITLAGAVATKLLAAGGAGGLALTAWALRAAGLTTREVTRRMMSFEILLYAVFMASLAIFGFGLRRGVFPGQAPFGLTVIPALFGLGVIVLVLAVEAVPRRAERKLTELAGRARHGRALLARLAAAPGAIHDGISTALQLLRHPSPALLGAVAYWAFDMAVLWAAFRAFGPAPPLAVIVLGYFIGQLANVIPIPGGIGGVEGGMIGAFIAFGLGGSVSVLAVLAYRLISFWLPIVPGTLAYLRLRQRVAAWNRARTG